MIGERTSDLKKLAVERSKQALRLASASLPHLSGLGRLVRIKATRRVAVAAVAASGLVLVNPDIFSAIPLGDAAFILAHELLHLALDTHSRQGDTQPLLVNIAHDYVINDILEQELEREPPLGGLQKEGARESSLEELVVELNRDETGKRKLRCWSPGGKGRQSGSGGGRSPLSRALADAGLVPDQPEENERPDPELARGDVLPDDREEEFEPELPSELRDRLRQQVKKEAAKAASLSSLRKQMDEAGQPGVQEPQRGEAMMRALREAYHTPWELALQRWMDAVAPGERTYSRPSRRAGNRRDVVLPGRQRGGWTLHVLLDTSGSMVDYLPKALGAIAEFCDSSGVSDVHVLQCDIEVTHDDWLEPQQLDEYQIGGFGGSDMSPGMNHLAQDPEVQAAIVLTDGYIDYPAEEPPYRVLWCLLGMFYSGFQPPYGTVIELEGHSG